ncbi:MAG: threonine synthase [Candidatus Bipolaricaulia bacterium]
MQSRTVRLRCRECRAVYSEDEAVQRWQCTCGEALDLEFVPEVDPSPPVRFYQGMWAFEELLPVRPEFRISLGESVTPLVPVIPGQENILVKLEYLLPTGSFKDRGAAVLLSKVRELGIPRVVEDSSGNAGASVAAYSTRAGVRASIFVPDDAPIGKVRTIEAFGAELRRIAGGREAVTEAAQRLCIEEKIYYAGHMINPYFLHGTKTFAFELGAQLDWNAPDAIVCPVGSGTLLLGIHLGFRELVQVGWLDHPPRLLAVQTEEFDPVTRAFHGDGDVPQGGETIADGMRIVRPVRLDQIVTALRETGGDVVTVSNAEIERALLEAHRGGFLIEPTSATTLAALDRYLANGTISDADRVILPLTGRYRS